MAYKTKEQNQDYQKSYWGDDIELRREYFRQYYKNNKAYRESELEKKRINYKNKKDESKFNHN